MRILIDINHPAHVHLFKNFIFEIKKKNNIVIVTVKDIPVAKRLLEKYGIDYICLGEKLDALIGKFIKQIHYNQLLYQLIKKYKIELGIGTSITLAHVSRFTKMKSFIFDDDDAAVEPLFAKFGHPFADHIISPNCLAYERMRASDITYAGYHELAYLHPNRFLPDVKILSEINIKPDEPYFILRFNAFKAHHDVGVQGLNLQKKRELINLLSIHGKIFITAERKIETEFECFRLNSSPEKIHSLIYYATMFIGDSQTMTSEAAMLGTPALKCNSFAGKLSIPNELENSYELCYAFLPKNYNNMLTKVKELISNPNLKQEFQCRRQKMLADKIDVTAFMVWFVENYPDSVQIMKTNPDYQYNFK